MICFAFPLAHEAALLLKDCTQKEQFTVEGVLFTLANYRKRPILVALIGMGEKIAERNTMTIFRYFRPKAVILAGYGGALVPQMKVGQVVMSANYTSEEVLTFLRLLSGFDFGSFCTANEIADTPKKRDEYARKSRAQVVDMETAPVAEIVNSRSLPFLAVRVISDEYDQVLPTKALAAGFDPAKGRATPIKLLLHLATHRADIAPFKKFVSGLSLARKNLTFFLEQLSDELPSGW